MKRSQDKVWKKDSKGGVEIVKLTPEQKESLTVRNVVYIPPVHPPKKLYTNTSLFLNIMGGTDEPSWFGKLGGYKDAAADWIMIDRWTWFLIGAIFGAVLTVFVTFLK